MSPAVQDHLEAFKFMNSFVIDKNKLDKEATAYVSGRETELITRELKTALEPYHNVELMTQTFNCPKPQAGSATGGRSTRTCILQFMT